MKRFALIALLFISLDVFAQEKFIEVEVTDTISLKPVDFKCDVYIDGDVMPFSEHEDYDPLAAEEKAKNRVEEIRAMLQSKKYKVGELNESIPGIAGRRRGELGVSVSVTGEPEVKKLKDLFKTNNDVTIVVTVLKYADELKAEEQLIKKLMDKARARAAVIGINSGLKPGRILEVKEGKRGDGMSSLEDFYSQIARLGGLGQDTGNYTGSLSKTFLVKFTAE